MEHKAYKKIIAYLLSIVMIVQGIFSSSFMYSNAAEIGNNELPALDSLGIDAIEWIVEESNVSQIYIDAKLGDIEDYTQTWDGYGYSDIYYKWGYIDSDNGIEWLYDTDDTDGTYPSYSEQNIRINNEPLHGEYRTCIEAYIYEGDNRVSVSSVLYGMPTKFDTRAPKIKFLLLDTTLGNVGPIISEDWHTKDYYYHIEIEEEGTSSSGIKSVSIQPYFNNQPCNKKWEYTYTDGEEILSRYTENITFSEFIDDNGNYIDGNYNVKVSVEDRAGNHYSLWIIPSNNAIPTLEEEKGEDFSFKMDNVKPIVSFSGDASDGGYYNSEECTVIINATDEMSGINSYTVTVNKDGIAINNDSDADTQINDKKWTSKRILTEEGEYEVRAIAIDKAGNEGVVVSKDENNQTIYLESVINFVIDRTAPTINIIDSDDIDILDVTDKRKEYNANNQEIDFVIEDRYIDYDKCTITIDKYPNDECESSKRERTIINPQKDEGYEWDINGDIGIFSYKLTSQGVYKIKASIQDKSGNKTEENIVIVIDTKAPVISNIRYTNELGDIAPKFAESNIYSNRFITVYFEVDDNIVGVNKVYYSVGIGDKTSIDTKNCYQAVHVRDNIYSILIPEVFNVSEFNNKIGIWAEDILGNVSNDILSYNMIYNTAYANISIHADKEYNKWLSEDVTFDVKVTDKKSGIDNIVYKINGNVVKEITFDKIVYEYSCNIIASEDAPTKEGYDVEVIVTNNAGSINTSSERVYIDKKAPVLDISGYGEQEHTSEDKIINFHISDVAYDETVGKVVATRTIDGITTSYYVDDLYPQSTEDVSSRSFSLEGYYSVYFVVVDGAGNESISNTIHFTVDKTAPGLSISGTTNNSVNQGEVSLTFTCIESFYMTNSVNISVVKDLDGQKTNSTINGFLHIGKTSGLTNTFTEDGTYTITFDAVDMAGNKAITETITFTIDKTAPELSFTGVTNYLVTNKSVTLSSNVIESYFAGNKITIVGTRTDIYGTVHEIPKQEYINGSKDSTRQTIFSEDGIYHLVMSAKDEAGNESEIEINFTIDKTPPQISYMDEIDNQYFSTFEFPYPMNEMILDISMVKYNIYINGIEYDGRTPIERDGKYSLYIKIEDEVGYTNEAYAEFIVDHTPPKIIVDGIEDNEVVHKEGQVSISLVDQEDDIESIIVNGKEIALSEDSKSYTLVYGEYGKYSIDIKCSDKAGNTIDESITFYYTNFFTDLFIITGLVLFIFGVGGALFVCYIKKNRFRGDSDD